MTPISMVFPGELVQVVTIQAGWGLRKRLADMGLTPGVQVLVVANQRPGPVILDLRGSRLALGHGMAHRILVRTR